MRERQLSSTTYPNQFLLVLSIDHISPATGKTPTVTLSKNGGVYGAAAGPVTEVANGVYSLAGNATDRNTLGELWAHITATGCDPVDMLLCDVVTVDVFAANGGLANVTADVSKWNGTTVATPATAGIPDVNTKNINNVATTSVTTINANQGTTQPVNFTGTGSGALAKSDMVDIAGASVSTSSAQIGVNAVNLGGVAQTGRDIGVSVLLSSGSGTGQLDFTSGVVKSNLTQILGTVLTETTGQIAAAFKRFFNISSPTSTMNVITTVTTTATATNLTNAPTAGDFTADMKTSLNAATPASVVGAVGSVAGNVVGSVGSLATQAKADVNAEVVDALTVDTYAEPSAPPAATASIKDMINWVKMLGRNKLTQTNTQQKVYADDGSTLVSTATVSDDGTTATRGKAS